MNNLIDFIIKNNVIVSGNQLYYSSGMLFINSSYYSSKIICSKLFPNYQFHHSNQFLSNIISINKPFNNNNSINTSNTLPYSKIENGIEKNDTNININNDVNVNKENIEKLEKMLENGFSEMVYISISKYSYTEILDILKYALQFNLSNIQNLFRPYWMEKEKLKYISYFSTIKSTSYASNKKRNLNDFTDNIIYSNYPYEKWNKLNKNNLSAIATLMQNHYDDELTRIVNNRKKFVLSFVMILH